MDGISWRFIQIQKHYRWFVSGVGGPKAAKGDLGAVKVLDYIRSRVVEDGYAKVPAVADDEVRRSHDPMLQDDDDQDDDDDPMNALDDISDRPLPSGRPQGVGRPCKPRVGKVRSHVRALEVRKRPPCSGVDEGLTTQIFVYMKPGTRSLYLRVDCLDWLLAYAADEHHFQGILRTDTEPHTAVAASWVEWNFCRKLWEVVVGPRCPHKAVAKDVIFSSEDGTRSCGTSWPQKDW